MTESKDQKTTVLDYLRTRPGRTAKEIGEDLQIGEIAAHGLVMELKHDGKAYDVRGPAYRCWYAATWGGYNPPGDVA